MITSAANRSWPGDCPIEAFADAGLPIPLLVRPSKITTIEAKDAETIGRLPPTLRATVIDRTAVILGAK